MAIAESRDTSVIESVERELMRQIHVMHTVVVAGVARTKVCN